ncbi:hypothetical protein EAG_10855 [Camponotus floridanus]|uniref:Uncharacterized protein n=1 Tax=Camponotus floridanus TaxID=104421 RepID=E2A9K3_CAMFO|nr:hypothetical protein EAG_10855 [Camponotus floridanus]
MASKGLHATTFFGSAKIDYVEHVDIGETKKHDDLGDEEDNEHGGGRKWKCVVARGWSIGNVKCRLRGLTTTVDRFLFRFNYRNASDHDKFTTRCVAKIRIDPYSGVMFVSRAVRLTSLPGAITAMVDGTAFIKKSFTMTVSIFPDKDNDVSTLPTPLVA